MQKPDRYATQGKRDYTKPRATNVEGDLCPGIYVEDPRLTLTRNINKISDKLAKDGISNAEFCRRSGVGRCTWQLLKKGKSWPEPGTLQKIASALGVPVEVLFRR